MGNRESDLAAGIVLTVLVSTLAIPILFEPEALGDRLVPWWAAFAVHLASLFCAMWIAEILPRPARLVAVAAVMASAATLVFLAPTTGWMPIVLIVSAAVCVYHLHLGVVAGVVVVNSLCLGVALRLEDAHWGDALMVAGLYGLIQSVSALSAYSQVVLERNRTELAVLNTELRSAQALLAESSRSDERLRIARDLHDVIGHQLTGLILELEIASHQTEGTAHERVTRARSVARDLMEDVRTTVADQRSAAPDLATALHQIIQGAAGLDVNLTVDADVPADAAAFTALVRCTQEVVTNTLRHAHATQLRIEVALDGDHIVLRSRDNGVGARSIVPGHGLLGIRERTEQLGGSADFASQQGFSVTARVPAT